MEEIRNSEQSSASDETTGDASQKTIMTTPSRRRLLDLLGTGTMAAIAGCAQDRRQEGQTKPTSSPEAVDSASGKSTQTDSQRPLRERVKIGIYQDPAEFNGRWGNVKPDWTRIYDPLVYPTHDMQAKPWLATDWERTGKLTWEFSLREGVKFHNGKPLTADAVLFSYDVLLKKEFWQKYFNMTPDGQRKIDDMTVEITTSQPTGNFPLLIAYPFTSIQHPDRSWENPIGTGPYQYEDHLPGQYVKVSAFDEYWNGKPKMDHITYRIIGDRNTRVQALVGNNVDVALRLPVGQYESLRNAPNLEAVTQPRPNSSHVEINTAKPPTDDLKFRKAINYAVSQKRVVAGAKNGIGIPSNGFIPPMVPWSADESLPAYGPNREKAKRLVSESSYDGETVKIIGQSGGRFSSGDPLSAQIIQQSLTKIGVEAVIRLMGGGAFSESQKTGDGGHLWLTGSGSYRASPLFLLRQVTGRYGPKPTNINDTMPDVVDRIKTLIAKGTSAESKAERHEAYRNVQHIMIAEKAVLLPLYYRKFLVGKRKKIGRFDFAPVLDTSKWENLEYYE